MRTRKLLETWGLATLVAFGVVYWVLSVFHDEIRYADSCDSTEPTSTAQSVALMDLKSRKASDCVCPRKGCQYLISQKVDGTLEITFWNIGERTGSQCVSQDCCYETYRYDASGKPVHGRSAA
jgi:hypothetical protein